MYVRMPNRDAFMVLDYTGGNAEERSRIIYHECQPESGDSVYMHIKLFSLTVELQKQSFFSNEFLS